MRDEERGTRNEERRNECKTHYKYSLLTTVMLTNLGTTYYLLLTYLPTYTYHYLNAQAISYHLHTIALSG